MPSKFNIEFVYTGAVVKRFHTMETLKPQNIAEHSFGVAWLCEWLTDGYTSKDLIMAALSHDLAEQVTGDIPAPAKRSLGIKQLINNREDVVLRNNGVAYADKLTGGELGVLKMADALDGMVYCLRECQLGNTTMKAVFLRFKSYVTEVSKTHGCKDKVDTAVNYLTTIFEEL